MVPLDYVLAVAVLTAPIPAGKPAPMPEHVCLLPTLVRVARYWEIFDPREEGNLLARAEDFDEDLTLVRRRACDLADAPWVSDALRYPGREHICEMLQFNREFTRTLKLRRESFGPGTGHLDQVIREADLLYRIWDLMRDARSECYYVSVRRQALQTLRQTIGPAAYYKGVIPPHVPVWRFEGR